LFIYFFDGEPQLVEMWLRYAASCHVRLLRLGVQRYDFSERLCVPNMTLICQQLTTLHIGGVKLEEHTLDFPCCPVLDVLEMQYCEINAEKISSRSLRHLSVEMCSFALRVRTCISCPSLVAILGSNWVRFDAGGRGNQTRRTLRPRAKVRFVPPHCSARSRFTPDGMPAGGALLSDQ
jgi:hypothetical protein